MLYQANIFLLKYSLTGTTLLVSSGDVELYPNPGSEIIALNFKGNYDEVVIHIYSLECKELYTDEYAFIDNDLKEIYINEFSAGIYFVEITTKQGKRIKRLVKK